MANSWLAHVAQYRKKNPNLSFKQALAGAKLSYVKANSNPKPKSKPKPRKRGGMMNEDDEDGEPVDLNLPVAEAKIHRGETHAPMSDQYVESYPSRFLQVDERATNSMNWRKRLSNADERGKYTPRPFPKLDNPNVKPRFSKVPDAIPVQEFNWNFKNYIKDSVEQMKKATKELYMSYKIRYPQLTDEQIHKIVDPIVTDEFAGITLYNMGLGRFI